MMMLEKALRLAVGSGGFQYVPNRGNAGDALIAAATAQVCRKLGLVEERNSRVVLVAGGGGIHRSYTCLRNRLLGLPKNKRVIILPSTVSAHWDVLQRFDNLTLMARESVTAGLARMNRVNVVEVHDAAFSFDYGAFERVEPSGVLHAFRTDGERMAGNEPYEGSRDVSAEDGGLWHLNGSADAARRFVGAIAGHREVVTDRLHVAIAAAKMGRQVVLKPGNYFKNRAVYESSLASFPNVTFED